MGNKSKNKKSLGKGLSAIFGEELNDTKTKEVIEGEKKQILASHALEIQIDKINPNKSQPRTFFEEEKLKELAESIKSVGIIEPIIVSKKDETNYEIIAGERRWRAAKTAQLKKIPCLVKDDIGENLLEIMLIENIQREDLTPIEEARSYEEILKKKKITQEKLATILGKTRTYITNIIRLLKLPNEVIDLLNQKKISVGHAKVLVGLPKKDILEIVEKIQAESLSVRSLEHALRKYNNSSTQSKDKISSKSSNRNEIFLNDFAQEIQNNLKTKVKILPINKKIGKIEIEYYNYEQLEDIKNMLGEGISKK